MSEPVQKLASHSDSRDPKTMALNHIVYRALRRTGSATLSRCRMQLICLATALLAQPVFALQFAPDEKFSYALLKGHARYMAAQSYEPPSEKLPRSVAGLDWDQYQSIRMRPDHALWAEDSTSLFRVGFFHLGLFFKTPVRMHVVQEDGTIKDVAYTNDLFDYGKSGLEDEDLPEDLGFAGFRINYHTHWPSDVAAFLGAAYFRAVGGEGQYGLSARGLAINTGAPEPEEFPRFSDYWFIKPAPGSDVLTVYALMQSDRVVGAYRFDIRPGDTLTMDVDVALYPRRPLERVGIAPLTSMYQHGENDQRMANDWRPEIHDSDGLSLWSGTGEWLWRPLKNPVHLVYSAFGMDNIKGFGLLQRDRDFDHYQDDGVFYEKRPSLWIEPKGDWGSGTVDLVEIPTLDETFDNIVAYWNPSDVLLAGVEYLYSYRMHWGAKAPYQSPLAHVVATRTGIGGVVGQPRKYFSRRFAIDFAGGDFRSLRDWPNLTPVISASRGEIEITSARPLEEIGGYRALFDLKPTDDSTDPIELRVHLEHNGRPMTEVWTYQYVPPPPEARHY